MATNRYGLDDAYFRKNLEHIANGAENHTPSEMFRVLANLMMTAADQAGYEVELDVKFNVSQEGGK